VARTPKTIARRPNATLARVAATRRLLGVDARAEQTAGARAWQLRALNYADDLGEVWYASKFYERALRNLILKVQTRTGPGAEWKDATGTDANDLLGQLTDANGETSDLCGMFGRLIFLNGEARLFGQVDADTGDYLWEMLSVTEIRVNDDGQYLRKVSPGAQDVIINAADDDAFMPTIDGAVLFKLWQKSPRYSDVPDAPMRAVLDVCEELLLLTRSVRGEIRSRLAGNGILGIPSELVLPFTEEGPRPDEDAEADGITRALMQAAQTAISDESAAAAMIPIVLRGPADVISKLQHYSFAKPTSENEAKRNECIRRLALGLDMPPEVLLGVSDVNHWSAWQIDEAAWNVHIEPIARLLVESLTRAWLRPALGEGANVRIWYDESNVVNHPDRSADFRSAFEDRVVSAASYRKAIGATEADAMSPEEQDRFAELAALAHRGSEATTTPSATTDTAAPAAGTQTVPSTTPDAPPAAASRPPVQTASVNIDRLLAGAEVAAWRCRELAGSRLRSKVHRATYASVENVDLAVAVHKRAPQGELDADSLVAGGGATFARALSAWGIDRSLAEQLVAAVETHARETLTADTPLPLPDDVIGLCAMSELDGSPA
jgi:hypothetical protein